MCVSAGVQVYVCASAMAAVTVTATCPMGSLEACRHTGPLPHCLPQNHTAATAIAAAAPASTTTGADAAAVTTTDSDAAAAEATEPHSCHYY